MNKGGFSWKRALGVTSAKRRISKATGIPFTRSGRNQKIGRMVTGGGCIMYVMGVVILLTVILLLLFI